MARSPKTGVYVPHGRPKGRRDMKPRHRKAYSMYQPVVYTRDGDRYIIVASKGGSPTHPAWYGNLVANPIVTVEVGGETFKARAIVVEGADRDRLYAAHAAAYPQFNDYQERTSRVIPVVLLERVA